MRWMLLLCSLALAGDALVAGHSSRPPDLLASGGGHGESGTVWVANRDRAEVAVFDARTGQVVAPSPITVGRGAHDIVVSDRAGKAYTTDEGDDALSVISTSTLQVVGTVPTGDMPHHISAGRDGRTLYVALVGTNKIALIDTATDTETVQLVSSALATARPHAPYPSHFGRFIFVPHEAGNLLTVLHEPTGGLVASIEPGLGPSEVLPSPRGRYLWVSLRNEGSVKRFDLWGLETPKSVPIGTATSPESLILTHGERTLIVSLRAQLARLAFIDTVKLELIKTIQIGGATLEENGIEIPPDTTFGDLAVMSPDGRRVYATFDSGMTGTGGVAVVDVRRQTKVDTWIYPATGRPHGIAYSTARLRKE